MSKYQAYPEYKDSGVEWLGEIPNHWHSTKIKYGYEITLGKMLQKEAKSSADEFRPYLKAVNIQPFGVYLEQVGKMWFSPAELRNLKLAYGDVLISEGGDVGRSAIWRNELPVCYFQNAINRARPRKNRSPRYLFYWMNTLKSSEFIDILCNKATIAHYTAEKVENSPLFIPSYGEAENIANFLDHETAKIDILIDKQQQLIQLLKEKRQAVISHAVTKGLNPNAPMRDSGVEWLGEVPEHWEIRAVSKLSQKITNGYVGPTRDILVPEGVPYIQATHIKKGKVNFDSAYFVRQSWSDAHAKSILVRGDVLIVQTGAGTGDIGLVTTSEEGFNCHALIIVQPVKSVISGEFLSMAFQSQYGYSVLYSIRTGGMHPHLNCGEVQFVKIPVPPINEQEEIIKHISEQVHKFDTLIGKQLLAIELMQERRTALISAAVTGKIDVRHHASRPAGNDTSEFSA